MLHPLSFTSHSHRGFSPVATRCLKAENRFPRFALASQSESSRETVETVVLEQFEDVLMVRGLQPSSDGFPEGLIDQRFLALCQSRTLTISTLPACF